MNRIKSDGGFLSPLSIASLIIMLFLGFALLLLFTNKDNYEVVETEKTELVALQDNISLDGDFFLGTGNINSQNYYYYMYTTESGGFKQGKVPVNSSTLFYLENETDKPLIKEFEFNYKGFLSGIMNSMNSERKSYEIYVPKGSIVEDIKVDLQ